MAGLVRMLSERGQAVESGWAREEQRAALAAARRDLLLARPSSAVGPASGTAAAAPLSPELRAALEVAQAAHAAAQPRTLLPPCHGASAGAGADRDGGADAPSPATARRPGALRILAPEFPGAGLGRLSLGAGKWSVNGQSIFALAAQGAQVSQIRV